MALRVECGSPVPLGARVTGGGVNFALFSRNATGVQLLLFPSHTAADPLHTIDLDPERNRTGDIWHAWVEGIPAGQYYAYRVDGPFDPSAGLRFNPRRILADPYGRAFRGITGWDFEQAKETSSTDNVRSGARAIVVDDDFNWNNVRRPKLPWADTIIYEVHVRGATIHPSSGTQHRGTYQGLAEKIPYFKLLGITAVELLPVQEFNEHEEVRLNPITGERLCNYWGYMPVAFFAPKESYSSGRAHAHQVRAFKEMTRAFHEASIEVILDVVFNHTAESNESGPTLSFRGIDNPVYYMLEQDRVRYKDFSGCLNTVNCNHPVVRDLIIDCLRHWVLEMHVDGFRFDLASVLGRDQNGKLLSNPPLLERIAEDPVLRDVKLIAEPWDAGWAFQVGGFPGRRWSEWNSRYRDDVRRFWRGDAGMTAPLATRVCGSSDLYQGSGKLPINSINYITCHDGFTLNDLVSYHDKHNEPNGHLNRDGSDANFSFNCGVEGETLDSATEAVRLRQIKNMMGTLLLSRGVPMILGGDEFRRTQRGNNNAYCQDNEISWYDWTLIDRNRELVDFVRKMIAFRKAHPVLSGERFYTDQEVTWFNLEGSNPNWDAPDSTLACSIRTAGESLCLFFNAEARAVEFRLPVAVSSSTWRIAVDTADAHEKPGRQLIHPKRLRVTDRSLLVLV